jgi:hypothetical protein
MICLLRRAGLRLAMLLLAGMAQLSAQTITSIVPDAGPQAGGTTITITGTGFEANAGVTIGGAMATVVGQNLGAGTITCTTPTSAILGPQGLIVQNADATSASGSFTYTSAPAPAVTALSPTSGPLAGGTSVTISGSNFVSGATASVGGVAATSVVFNSATSLTITTPGGNDGPAAVVVTNPDTQISAPVSYDYLGTAPAITQLAPASGALAGGTSVTITGTSFYNGATVTVGGVTASPVVFNSATSLTITTPGGSDGPANVVVTNPDGQPSPAAAFDYLGTAPAITQLAPAAGALAGGTSVAITGTSFYAGATVTVGGITAPSVVFNSATSLTITTPAAPGGVAGPETVVVTNPDTQPSNAGTYTYEPAPLITAVTPGLGPVAGGTAITISGSNFLTGATVTIGGVPAGAVAVTATSISCTTPAGPAGPATLVVTNPDTQSASSSFTFQGSGPAISVINPALAPASGGTALTITGSGFLGSSVTIGGASATAVVVVSPTEITCVSPAGTPGPANVVVTNSDLTSAQTGTLSDAFIFQGPLPTITQILPVWGPVGTAITISGTNFAPGAQVMIDRVAAGSVVVADAQTVTCTIPGGVDGFVTVTVTNPDFTSAILVDGFNVIGPTDLSAHRCGGSHGVSVLLLAPFIAWRLLLAARRRRALGALDGHAGPRPPPPA